VDSRRAAGNGVNLGAFDGTLITMNGSVDLFGYVRGMTAFCDSNNRRRRATRADFHARVERSGLPRDPG
jgi:hypothetical protein